jgi:peptidyl-prolyl cis-trans isomerase C
MKRALPLFLLLFAASAACHKAPETSAAAATTAAAPGTPPQTTTAPAQTPTAAPAQDGKPAAAAQAPPPAAKPVPAKLPEVLARVNGEPVERWELENGVKRAEMRAGSAVPPEKRNEVLRGVLDQLVAYHVLVQESRARKIAVSDAEVDEQMSKVRKSFATEDAFQKGIAAQGLTVDQLRRQTRMSLAIEKIIESEINSKVSVGDAEVDTFYKQNLERFKQGESVHAAHILIAVPQTADPAQKQQAKAKAQEVLKQARAAGSDFAKLAQENSQDPGSAPNGGDLGFFEKGQMTPTFEEAAFKLKPGAISDVVETPFGYHIIKVIERKPARTVPLSEVAPKVKEFLTENDRQAKLEKFVEQVKSKAKIEILV